jgi:hypothetical protein
MQAPGVTRVSIRMSDKDTLDRYLLAPRDAVSWRPRSCPCRHCLGTMAGAGPLTIREVARRVKRDVKAGHGDVHELFSAGVLQKADDGLVVSPFDVIWVDVMLSAA